MTISNNLMDGRLLITQMILAKVNPLTGVTKFLAAIATLRGPGQSAIHTLASDQQAAPDFCAVVQCSLDYYLVGSIDEGHRRGSPRDFEKRFSKLLIGCSR